MSAYLIHEKETPIEQGWICSRPTEETVMEYLRLFEEMDEGGGNFAPERYEVLKKEYCPSANEGCAAFKHGICLLKDPEADCPEFRKEERNSNG